MVKMFHDRTADTQEPPVQQMQLDAQTKLVVADAGAISPRQQLLREDENGARVEALVNLAEERS